LEAILVGTLTKPPSSSLNKAYEFLWKKIQFATMMVGLDPKCHINSMAIKTAKSRKLEIIKSN